MTFEERINEDLKAAMKAQDKQSLRGVRAIKQAILLANTDGSHEEINEEKAIKLLQKLVKQRRESLKIFEDKGREDLALVEREELEVIERYLPKAMSAEEVEAAVKKIVADLGASSMKDMGKVMGVANKEFAGRADAGKVSEIVKKLLA
ncbi:MAG: GatB/YqeY domain-containing protein [Saprospirales bacterium]|nr:GatB/YqeY domain-containing protein [Saprospirales bacterium]